MPAISGPAVSYEAKNAPDRQMLGLGIASAVKRKGWWGSPLLAL